MEIKLKRLNDAFHFQAQNESGNVVDIDANPNIGGVGAGARPMELLIMGLGGCSSIDILLILKKQKQIVTKYEVNIHATRKTDETPAIFDKITIEFVLHGADLDETKVERAIDLSMNKYCSVTKILEKTASINHSFKIIRN